MIEKLIDDSFNERISWYLNLNINKVKNLFSDQILPYEIDIYICHCGQIETIIKDTYISLDKYICKKCKNEEFLSASKYNNNFIWYENVETLFDDVFLSSLTPNIIFNEKEKTLLCDLSINIPVLIDLASEKITYNKKSIFEIRTNSHKKLEKIIKVNFELYSGFSEIDIYFENITENDLINKNIYLNIYQNKILNKLRILSQSNILKSVNSLEEFEFFLINDKLIDLDFFYWKNINLLPKNKELSVLNAIDFITDYRKEKTLKKNILLNYKNQMKQNKSYTFIYIYSITRCIKDINILNRMILIDLKPHLDEMSDFYSLFVFIKFLSSKFSDKQIEKLFLSYADNELFWLIDSVALFSEIYDNLDDFEVSKCKYDILHDDIINYHQIIMKKELFKTKFNYEKKLKEACVNIEEYDVKLPLDGIELYAWSKKLQNCLSGYWRLIKEKRTVVFGFYKNDEIKFAVEIKNNRIVQSKSKYNKDLQNKEMSLVLGWFKEYFSKGKSK